MEIEELKQQILSTSLDSLAEYTQEAPKRLTEKQMQQASKLLEDMNNDRDICTLFGVDYQTLKGENYLRMKVLALRAVEELAENGYVLKA